MGKEIFVSRSNLLLLLLLLMCGYGIGAREMNVKRNGLLDQKSSTNVLRLRSMDADCNYKHDDVAVHHLHAATSSQIHHHPMNPRPRSKSFFFLKDLEAGKTVPIFFPMLSPASHSKFLPREITESIPFSSKHLPRLRQLFSIPEGTYMARKMELTFGICEGIALSRETKFCATSLESMLDFVRGIFGSRSGFRVLTTNHIIPMASANTFQNYTIREMPKEIPVSRVVPCHPLTYPYAVFNCHWIPETRIFKVSLEAENGNRIEAVAACHMDTSEWDPSHVAFQFLGTKPGSSEACHFFPPAHLIWIPDHEMHV